MAIAYGKQTSPPRARRTHDSKEETSALFLSTDLIFSVSSVFSVVKPRYNRRTRRPPMTRREFLAATVTAVPALSFAEDQPAMIPAVDTHQHLWDLTKIELNWLKEGDKNILAQSYTPKEYAEATAGLNVVKAVYMEVDVVAADKQKEADYVIELCNSGKTPTCAAVLGGYPSRDGFAEYVRQFKGSKYVKGIRQVIHEDGTPKGYSLDPKFVIGVQLMCELVLSFDIWFGV
jgi:hypothetical protein